MQIKKALVTGVSKGLGRELCLILSSLGYEVHGISRTDKALLDQKLSETLSDYYQIDLAEKNAIEQFINKNSESFDLFILNASDRSFKFFSKFEGNEIESLINCSFTHQLLILNHVLKGMSVNNKGYIMIISSKSGLKGYSSGSLYCAVKSAWITFHESLSRELKGSGIKVLTIIPDSFSDRNGNKTPFFHKNISRIHKLLLNVEKINKSKLIYSLRLKTRILLFLEYCKKAFFI